jgi:DNA-directed RNA polymerase specialized sigma24 family protein
MAVRQFPSIAEHALGKLLKNSRVVRGRNADDRYVHLRRTLIRFFEWNGAANPEDLAAEAFLIVLEKMACGVEIRDVHAYARKVAHNLLMEYLRDVRRFEAFGDMAGPPSSDQPTDERLFECLRICKEQLTRGERALIEAYYCGDKTERIENRRKLALKFGLTAGALRLQAHRVRKKLAAFVRRALEPNLDL